MEGFGVAHYFLLLGIVLTAAGIKKAIGHAYDPLATAEALVLARRRRALPRRRRGFRRILGLGRSPHRASPPLLALATIPLGTEVAAVAQLAALVVILAAALAGEGSLARGLALGHEPHHAERRQRQLGRERLAAPAGLLGVDAAEVADVACRRRRSASVLTTSRQRPACGSPRR